MRYLVFAALSLCLAACDKVADKSLETAPEQSKQEIVTDPSVRPVDEIARAYVVLALAFGEYDENYVDAYTGPGEWREEALAAEKSLSELFEEATGLAAELALTKPVESELARVKMLRGNVRAMMARIRMVRGETLGFNDETALIYDAVVPVIDTATFDAALAKLDAVLPGEGSVAERRDALQQQLTVPDDKIEEIIRTAIAECRARTLQHYVLPENEKFVLELVRDKPWSGYNYYQGDFESLIQINLDQPFRISRALDLGCHEGYPGHHVWNIFTERNLLKENGWIEFYVFPLFSPGAFFAEGSANYGVDIAFPADEKLAYERDVLYPIAGLDPALAPVQGEVAEATRQLQFVTVYVARKYLDGEITRDQAVETVQKYSLVSKSRAEQSVDFMETYRGYVINYSLGYNMIKAYIEANAETNDQRWDEFGRLLRTPTGASDIALAK